jgi:predicted ester cyclase
MMSMSAEENKAIVRRWFEDFWNKDSPAAIDELCATNLVLHGAPPGVAPDFEGMKRAHAMHHAGFPDMHFTIEDMVAEGDKVATRFTLRGTHKGEWAGIPPTGKQVMITGIEITRLEGIEYAETWFNMDMLGMMQQLSVVPPTVQASK